MATVKWSMYNIDFFRGELPQGVSILEFMQVRPNVVRIIPLTGRDLDNLLSVGSPIANTLQSIRQVAKIFNQPAIRVFYGKLVPETSLDGLNFGAEWNADSPVAKFAENAEELGKNLADQGTRASAGWARVLGMGTGFALEGYSAAKAVSGLSTDKVGLYTMKTYKGMRFKVPPIKCRYYMPEDVDFAIKSLVDLMRIVYPSVVEAKKDDDVVIELLQAGVKLATAVSGYTAVASPTPAVMQVGHLYDVAPVCVTGVNVRGGDGYYNHRDGGINIAMPVTLEITITLDMYMNLPTSLEGGDYHWFNLKMLDPGTWAG